MRGAGAPRGSRPRDGRARPDDPTARRARRSPARARRASSAAPNAILRSRSCDTWCEQRKKSTNAPGAASRNAERSASLYARAARGTSASRRASGGGSTTRRSKPGSSRRAASNASPCTSTGSSAGSRAFDTTWCSRERERRLARSRRASPPPRRRARPPRRSRRCRRRGRARGAPPRALRRGSARRAGRGRSRSSARAADRRDSAGRARRSPRAPSGSAPARTPVGRRKPSRRAAAASSRATTARTPAASREPRRELAAARRHRRGRHPQHRDVGVAVDDEAGRPSPSAFASRTASVPTSAGSDARRAAAAASPATAQPGARLFLSEREEPHADLRARRVVAAPERLALGRQHAHDAPAAASPGSRATEPERSQGWRRRAERSRPGRSVTSSMGDAKHSRTAGSTPALATGRSPHDRRRTSDEPARERDQRLPAPAHAQPGRLVSLGRGGARAGARRGQAAPRLDRLQLVPLVPRDGARVLRGRSRPRR